MTTHLLLFEVLGQGTIGIATSPPCRNTPPGSAYGLDFASFWIYAINFTKPGNLRLYRSAVYYLYGRPQSTS